MPISQKRPSISYKVFQTLSLDVIIGVLAIALFSIQLLNIDLQAIWLLILVLATWSFYTIDHLIDGIKSQGKSTIYRHLFHFNYKLTLSILSVFSGIAALTLSLILLDQKIIIFGIAMACIVLVYFSVLTLSGHKRSFLLQKELIIALVYIIGIWMAPLIWAEKKPETFTIIIIIVLILLAWAEGIMASWFDYENDFKEGHSSFTVLFGKQNTRRFLIILHILLFIIIKISVLFVTTELQFAAIIILALMNISLLLILLYPKTFSKNNNYRIFGEMVFWLPFPIILF